MVTGAVAGFTKTTGGAANTASRSYRRGNALAVQPVRCAVIVREMLPPEQPAVLAMMALLWPGFDDTELVDDAILVLDRGTGKLGGFFRKRL
jgi:hypothetical protein